jgi:hypothetical protein
MHESPPFLIMTIARFSSVGVLSTAVSNFKILSREPLTTANSQIVYLTLALCQELVHKDDLARVSLFSLQVVPELISTLQSKHPDSVKYVALCLIHELISNKQLVNEMIDSGCVGVLSQICVQKARCVEFNKLCIHAICECLLNIQQHNICRLNALQIFLNGILPVLLVSLFSEDTDLALVSLHLIQIMAAVDVARPQLRMALRFIPCAIKLLGSTPATTQQVILQILGTLCIGDDEYKAKLVHHQLHEKLHICMKSSLPTLSQVALFILHDLAMVGEEACMQISETKNLFRSLAGMISPIVRLETQIKVCETLGFLCSVGYMRPQILHEGLVEVLISMFGSRYPEITQWAVLILDRVLLLFDSLATIVVTNPVIFPTLLTCTNFRRTADFSITAVKCLVMLTFKSASLAVAIRDHEIPALLSSLVHLPLRDVQRRCTVLEVLILLVRQATIQAALYNQEPLKIIEKQLEAHMNLSTLPVRFRSCHCMCTWPVQPRGTRLLIAP